MMDSKFVTISEKDPLVIVKRSMKWDDIKSYIPAVDRDRRLNVVTWGHPEKGNVILHAQRCCARPCIAGSNGLFEYMAGEDETITSVLAFGTTEVVKFFGTPGGKEVAAILRPRLLRSCEVNFIVVGRDASHEENEDQDRTCKGYESISSEIVVSESKYESGSAKIQQMPGDRGGFKGSSFVTTGQQQSCSAVTRSEVLTKPWEHRSPNDPATSGRTFFNQIRRCDSKRDSAGSAPGLNSTRRVTYCLRSKETRQITRLHTHTRGEKLEQISRRPVVEEVDLMPGSVLTVGICVTPRDRVFPGRSGNDEVTSRGNHLVNDSITFEINGTVKDGSCRASVSTMLEFRKPSAINNQFEGFEGNDVPVDNSGFTNCKNDARRCRHSPKLGKGSGAFYRSSAAFKYIKRLFSSTQHEVIERSD